MTVVHLSSFDSLERAISAYGIAGERAVIVALRKTARFGHTAVHRTYTRTRDPFKIRASGSYGQAFITQDIPNGALIANAMRYAFFVEQGRRKGRMPPLKPILEWVYQKRLAARPKPIVRVKRPRKQKEPFIGPTKPRKSRAAADGGAGGGVGGGSEGTGKQRYSKIRSKKTKRQKRVAMLVRRMRAKKAAVANAMAIAWRVRRKIGKRGLGPYEHGFANKRGRWVFRRTMPIIAKRAARDIKRELSRLNRHPPRG